MSILRNFGSKIAQITRSTIIGPAQYRQISLGVVRYREASEDDPKPAVPSSNFRYAHFNIDRTKIPAKTTVTKPERTHAAKPQFIRRYGYKDKISHGGLLPRLNCGQKLPMPDYR